MYTYSHKVQGGPPATNLFLNPINYDYNYCHISPANPYIPCKPQSSPSYKPTYPSRGFHLVNIQCIAPRFPTNHRSEQRIT